MTPKEKVKELINEYLQVYDGRVLQAKKCSIITVCEILNALFINNFENRLEIKYWQEVKQEIEKL